ncbi:hypothetical protein SORBI_3003G347480 [Sorghum bicolor]|uniref:Uncharacterized protein n=1 Tax=Sorghum bicolor TaxID=4558 RepID=A0A1W0W0C6_SORBI|nr:hypothetical protein SORBI_3003G347480 [Sorghum bicolor]
MTGLGMVRVIIKLDVIPRQENRWIERTETLEMSCRAAGHLLYSHAGAATRRMASGFGEVEMSEARASHVISDWVQTEFVSQWYSTSCLLGHYARNDMELETACNCKFARAIDSAAEPVYR